MRLDPGLRAWVYGAFALLFVSGGAWLVADLLKDAPDGDWWQTLAADLLMIHGGAAMLTMVLLGAMIPLHALRAWRADRNRISGSAMGIGNAALVVTAFGLYYAGGDMLRSFTSDVHIAVGFGVAPLMAAHVVLGRRSRNRATSPGARTRPTRAERPPVSVGALSEPGG